MNEHEREQVQADALDAYLTQRQAGQPEKGAHQSEPAAFAGALLDLARATHPDATFAARLEAQLRAEAKKKVLAAQRRPQNALQGIAATWAATSVAIQERMSTMNKRLLYPMAGAAILALALFAYLVLTHPKPPEVGPAQLAQVTPTAWPTQTPAQPTHTPVPATQTPASAATRPPTSTPTPTEAVPTATSTVPPTPTPGAPVLLPVLADWQGTGAGGGGMGGPEAIQRIYLLAVELPDGPAQMTVYLQREPQPLTPPYAAQVATRLGVDGPVYQSIRLASASNPDAETERGYLAVDGAREVRFEASGVVHYTDLNRTAYIEGHWRQPEGVPPLEGAIQAARTFLQAAGLLEEEEVEIVATGDTLLFYRLVDAQWPLLEPVARVNIWIDGQVGEVHLWPLTLDALAPYPILSAEEAWSLLSSGEPDARVWQDPYRAAELPAWGAWRHQNPTFWTRAYDAGEEVHRFGVLQVWFPAETGGTPYVTIGSLLLTGDVQPLAAYGLRQYTSEQPMYVHVWGQAEDAGDRRALRLEGWEPVQESYWTGTVRRQGDEGTLVMDGGRTIHLPNLPADLGDGTPVAVLGGQVEERLEWHLIQQMRSTEPPSGARPAEMRMTVEQVDLVYLALAPNVMPPERSAELGTRAVQPAWRFGGHTDQGAAFEVYVQAVRADYLER